MILKNIPYGAINVPAFAEFGMGDIAVAHAVGINHAIVIFQNQEPREIGSEGDIKAGQTTDDSNPEIIMVFDNENSIDVVIRQLLAAKEKLHEILTK